MRSQHESELNSPQKLQKTADDSSPPPAEPLDNLKEPNSVQFPQFKTCHDMMNKLKKRDELLLFLDPVDPVAHGIPDYFAVVQLPMDYKKIIQKLTLHKYAGWEEWAEEVRLVFSNAIMYNGAEHHVGETATKEKLWFEEQVQQHLTSKQAVVDEVAGEAEVVEVVEVAEVVEVVEVAEVVKDETVKPVQAPVLPLVPEVRVSGGDIHTGGFTSFSPVVQLPPSLD